ncbi:hypothetical protein TNCV_2240291 [Trichonephila clavipes]|nr:hypothetical protein TNCV_2240291 [Trichonephila clavipes]
MSQSGGQSEAKSAVVSPQDMQGRLSITSFQWVEKMSNKLVWELNSDDFTYLPPEGYICLCTSSYKLTKAKMGILCLGSFRAT